MLCTSIENFQNSLLTELNNAEYIVSYIKIEAYTLLKCFIRVFMKFSFYFLDISI